MAVIFEFHRFIRCQASGAKAPKVKAAMDGKGKPAPLKLKPMFFQDANERGDEPVIGAKDRVAKIREGIGLHLPILGNARATSTGTDAVWRRRIEQEHDEAFSTEGQTQHRGRGIRQR